MPDRGVTTVDEAWLLMDQLSIATEAEMELVTTLLGYSLETMEAILYARTGWRSFDQFEDDELWANW